MEFISIAIDGPAGAGKSTVAKGAAARLGYLYVDTGAIYRTVALFMDRKGLDVGDPEQVVPLLPQVDIRLAYGQDGLQKMYLGEEDVTEKIRENRVSALASRVSALPEVRAYLLELQRKLAREHNVIMDGRDIGTVVLPHADVKIFLTASLEIRAHRRVRELAQRGQPAEFDLIFREMEERDRQDRERSVAPLRQADDAVCLDTSALDLEGSIQALLEIVRKRLEH